MQDQCYVYFIRDMFNLTHPIATVAIKYSKGIWCRSLTVCSPADHFSKEYGRKKALALVNSAFKNKRHIDQFGSKNNSHKNYHRLAEYDYRVILDVNLKGQPDFRGQYNVSLTEYEMDVVLPKSISSQIRSQHCVPG
jgi:hypothetical protein